MKKIRRYWTSALALLLALLMCSCSLFGGKQENTTEAESTQEIDEDALIPERDVVLFGGDSDYRIVYAESANNQVKALLSELIAAVKDDTGAAPKYATDRSKSSPEIENELILGVAERKASEKALTTVPTIGYEVRFVGNKLVITASSDALLKEAMDRLIAAWRVEDGKIVISNKTVIREDTTNQMNMLYQNGTFAYRVVVPLKASDALYDDAVYLTQSLSLVTNTVVDIVYDEKTPASDDAYEICLGRTNRAISQTLYEEVDSVFEYKIAVNSNQIAVAALQDAIMTEAVRLLYSDLYSELRYAYTGVPAISLSYGRAGSVSEVAASLPSMMSGDFHGIYASGADRYVIFTDNVTAAEADAYVDLLQADGAEILQEYNLGDNKYTLLRSEKYCAYVSYLAMENAVRTQVGPADTVNALHVEETTANVSEPILWQLEVDNIGSGANGGMSYVMKLTDGSFIIVDGGYNTQTEADNLYSLLKENTPAGEKPVISGWFITHLHGDHYGALLKFANSYSAAVDVKAFYYNFPGVSVSSSENGVSAGSAKEIVTATKKWKSAVRYDALHSGMRLGFAGLTVDVLCTHEDVYPMSFIDGNDTCTVLRFTTAGQKILILGDARESQSITMLNTIPAAELKADIVQFSHHGYEGCTEAFYKITEASTILWPMNIIGRNSSGGYEAPFRSWYNNGMAANKYVRESETVKKVIVAGAGTTKLELPYTPTGDKVPDYNKIYNDRLALYQ